MRWWDTLVARRRRWLWLALFVASIGVAFVVCVWPAQAGPSAWQTRAIVRAVEVVDGGKVMFTCDATNNPASPWAQFVLIADGSASGGVVVPLNEPVWLQFQYDDEARLIYHEATKRRQ
jgi:drug/metabolite transporter (DMT)-like permease